MKRTLSGSSRADMPGPSATTCSRRPCRRQSKEPFRNSPRPSMASSAHSLKQFADAQKKSLKNAVPALFGPDGEGDPKNCFGDFCLAVARNDRGYLEKHYGSVWSAWHTKAAMGEASGATGGYVVPARFLRPASGHHRRSHLHPPTGLRAADGQCQPAISLPRHHHRPESPASRRSSAACK